MPGLGASFGRGAATAFQRDLTNSDCILIMGSNMAEAHPVGFRWALKARERGAPLIHVDPRFTRTSAVADVYVQIRAGSDVAFLGGLINYVIEQGRWFRNYVLHYTNAATILSDEFRDAEDLDGVFAGLDPELGRYERAAGAWGYLPTPGPAAGIATDPSLSHPRCVFQVLRRHFARYTPEMVAKVCGCAADDVGRVAELLCRNSGPERTSAVVYALGWAQHSTGVQMIRAAAILQLLLGNIGRPGGGIMAMRGQCGVQGSTDIPTLYDLLPGYVPQPAAVPEHATLKSYLEHGHGFQSALESAAAGFWHEEAAKGYWSNLPKFVVSLLKAWYGVAARRENAFGYDWLPKYDRDYSELATFFRMARGELKGLFLIGQNPAAGAPNAQLNRAALRHLDWLVVRDCFEHESANFWYADPGVGNPKEIKTEVFFLPAAAMAEKEGTLTNTERLLQWHEKAAFPPGECRSDAWFIYHLGRRLKELYASSTRGRDAPIKNLTWDYAAENAAALPEGDAGQMAQQPDIERIVREINGWDVASGKPLRSFAELNADGSTACGAWIYCGVQPEPGLNRARSRNPALKGGLYPQWGFAWPANRRLMYNRASAAPDGRPWSERKKLIWWDAKERRWSGYDEPDFEPTKDPGYRPAPDARGMDAIAGDAPFIMHPDGRGWLFAPFGVKDGPLPVHYEPRESPLLNPLHRTQVNPTLTEYPDPLNPLALPADPKYPIVATTYRLTEHYLSGPMSRFNSWLNELQPEMFIELGLELASERGIEHGGWVVVSTPRGRIEARAMVTGRLKPLLVAGRRLHQIGLPIHWGYAGETVGAIANDLTSLLTDVNVSMHEAKAFTCDIEPGRLSGVRRASPLALAPPPYCDELVPETAEEAQPEGRQRRRGPSLRRAAHTEKSAGQGFSVTDAMRLIEKLTYPFRRAAPVPARVPTGFFTDTTLCIGCKACEVACKQWNQLAADGFKFTGMSYDNTATLSASTWRHVAFAEQFPATRDAASGWGRWLMMSDVCKHCSAAPCHMACPTGAIVATEFSNVYIQGDICNGCGYCVAACPFGVITRGETDGVAHKCTLCFDRQRDGLLPACAKSCPTGSIQFGPIAELRARADERVRELHHRGITDAYLYGAEPTATYSPMHAFFLLRDRPSVYGLPDKPLAPQLNMRADYLRSAASTVLWLAALIATLVVYG